MDGCKEYTEGGWDRSARCESKSVRETTMILALTYLSVS